MALLKLRVPDRVMTVLAIPWVDRTVAVVATSPFAYRLFDRFAHRSLDLPRAVAAFHTPVLVATMVLRRSPLRVTPNPWYWLLAFAATYWGFIIPAFGQRGAPLVALSVSGAISLFSLIVMIYARLSLGKSIGFVPAHRGIVIHGAYRFVRHPIYTAAFIAYLAFLLRNYSLWNAGIVAVGVGLLVAKSFIEENFLKADPEYAAYLAKVRYRWIPWGPDPASGEECYASTRPAAGSHRSRTVCKA